ncbi:MAG TPA: protein kinase [Actinomycetota bacterium]|nr:protein kinase [Actinomycetota bacterium]
MDADRVVGSQVAGYTIESVLGHGGMGIVYLARQRSPDRRLALKLINPAFADDDSFRQRFLREATAAAAIDHPHILPVYDAGEADGVLFIAMRLVVGEDLRTILRARDSLALERVVTIIGQVGEALDAAHARGLVHRDVKPGNIPVASKAQSDDADFCYLTDFGVSAWMTSSAGTMTSTGQMVGSVNYAAPEQIETRAVHASADIYSLGCVLYECLTGRAPFSGRSPAATLYAQLHEEPPRPSSLRPGLPAAVDVVVERALRKQSEERYASCRELTADIRAALAGEPLVASPKPVSRGSRSRAKSMWIAAAVVVTMIVVTLAGIGLADRNEGGAGVTPSPSVSSTTSPAPERILEGVQVTASSVAPPSEDAAGNTVTYLPRNVIDGDVDTAWRTHGNGHGETLTLLFSGPVDVVQVGMIPGYAKIDPASSANRFLQDRIITDVRYLIPGIAPTEQHFLPDPYPQLVRFRTTTTQITVKILGTTKAGGLDFTAISEIYVYGYPQ